MRAVMLEGRAVNPDGLSWDVLTSLIDTDIYEQTDENNKWEHIAGHEIVLTNKVKIDREVFDKYPEIKYVGVFATGYNAVDLDAAKERGIIVTNVPNYSTDSVAQFTWALLLELMCKVGLHSESVKKGDWIRSDNFCYWLEPVVELSGKVLGIYGFGNIGRRVATIAQAFGMKVLAYTKHPSQYLSYVNANLRFCDEKTLFDSSDVISLHCPLTAETQGLINADTISLMKPGVTLINVARGGLVQEEDLAEALRTGKIRSAALDVVAVEPMAVDSPLRSAPNVIITPHIAWASREARMRLIQIAVDNIRAYLTGDPTNVVQ